MLAGFRRHLVGKTLINVFHLISMKYAFWQASEHTDIQRTECCLNNTIHLRRLIRYIMPYVIPTKWRSYRGHRFCDVTSPCVCVLSLSSLVLYTRVSPEKKRLTLSQLIGEYLAKLQARTWMFHALCAPVHAHNC